jgi:hypothetical protein
MATATAPLGGAVRSRSVFAAADPLPGSPLVDRGRLKWDGPDAAGRSGGQRSFIGSTSGNEVRPDRPRSSFQQPYRWACGNPQLHHTGAQAIAASIRSSLDTVGSRSQALIAPAKPCARNWAMTLRFEVGKPGLVLKSMKDTA